ncbi:MAG TPA: ABC transporter permease [Verrucomicrobiae bacterium]|nr:ABC transporter permease [Verrucomicrobiae bacterium]
MSILLQDVRYASRILRKSPGFTVLAILTLALGIGANTAIFSVLDAVVLRPLPFVAPNRLAHLTGKFALGDQAGISPPDYADYRAANRTFEQMAVLNYEAQISNLSGEGRPEQVTTSIASWNLFNALGIRPLLGRTFAPADEQAEQPQVAILGNGIWRTHFGADQKIIGKNIVLDGRSLSVIGVLSSDPSILSKAQIWLPMPLLAKGMNMRLNHFLVGVGKLKPGVTLEQAQADLDSDAQPIDARFPDTNKGWGLKIRPLATVLVGPVQTRLFLIAGAVGLLLLIACANIANLLLARGETRQRELAVRRALGASRKRIVQQMLTESIVLASGGGIVGVLAGLWGVAALRALAPSDLPRLNEIQVNGVVLAFTAGVSLFAAILFGLAPALRSSQAHFADALKQAGRGMHHSRKKLGSTLVVGQIAVSLTLLVGGGLLVQSFWRLIHVNPGFQPQNAVTAKLEFPSEKYGTPQKSSAFLQQFQKRAGALPGVQAIGAVSELPLTGEYGDLVFHIPGHAYEPGQFEDAEFRQTTPGYFEAMRIPLLAGRSIRWSDTANAPPVMVVDQAFAKQYFPDQSPIGKQLDFLGPPSGTTFTRAVTIVGLVGDVSHDSLDAPQRPEMYVPVAQSSVPEMNIVVRTSLPPGSTATVLQNVLSSLDKNEALSTVRTMQDVIASSVSQPRFSALLVAIFAVLALGLAVIGLYGVISYSVTQRTNEIGIRMALGATPRDILQMILGGGIKLALIGTAIGVALALSLGRFLQSLLFEVRATDPVTLAVVAVLLLAVALAACYIPAHRAMKVDPMVALRYE